MVRLDYVLRIDDKEFLVAPGQSITIEVALQMQVAFTPYADAVQRYVDLIKAPDR